MDYNENYETIDLSVRFENITKDNINKLSIVVLKKLIKHDINYQIIDIIMNMLSYDYNDKLPLSKISEQLYEINNKTINVKITNDGIKQSCCLTI
jgi:predicted nucleic acid binding AN1-type Zn finger protein